MALLEEEIQRRKGKSSETKPTLNQDDVGSEFYETDTFQTYVWTGFAWALFARPVTMSVANGPSTDAFGVFKVRQPVGLFENKNIHSRNRSLWEEPIVGAIIVHGAVTGGPFQVAEIVTGQTSGTIGTVTAVDSGALTVTYTVNHNDFEDGETILGGTSAATAAVSSHDTGSHISHDRDTASVILKVGMGATDSAMRQTHRYMSYVPNKAQDIDITFLDGAADTNVFRGAGYYDDDNGLFMQQLSSGVSFVVRSKATGSVVDTLIDQADWNIDKFDGTGPSGLTLDLTKRTFLHIDFGWQGSGPVRFGFWDGGNLRFAHVEAFRDQSSTVFMSTPSLPLRYEIHNTGVTTSTHTMQEICSAVVSQGGEDPLALGYSASSDVTPRAVTVAGGEIPLFAIRLKGVHPNGGANRVTAKLSNFSVFASGNFTTLHFELKHIHDPDVITATWADVGGGSAVEFSTDISAITGTEEHRIEEGYSGPGTGNKGGSENEVSGDKLDQHRFLTQNFDSTNSEVFVVFAQSVGGTASVYTHITWVEFD